MTSEKNPVATPSTENLAIKDILQVHNALMGGTRAMRAYSTTFLPKEKKEKDVDYNIRLSRSTLYPGYSRTIKYLVGQVFSRPIVLPEEMPDKLSGLMDDIDLNDNNINTFFSNILKKGINHGSAAILVDMQPGGKVRTVAEEKEKGIRPYCVNIDVENIIGVKTDNSGSLTQVRIYEEIEVEGEDGYSLKNEKRIRVLEPGKYEVYTYSEKDDDYFLTDDGVTSLDFIPLVVFMPGDRRSAVTAMPPLDDLAWINVAHWQSQSDQRNILHVARVPLLFGKMIDVDVLAVGGSRLTNSQDEKGDLKYVEHTGAAIGSGRQDLEDLKKDMALFGMQLMAAKPGSQTATEKSIEKAESDSTLKSWALLLEEAVNTALNYMGQYADVQYPGGATVNTDYRSMLTDFTAKELLDAVREGILSKEVVFTELKKRGAISSSFDWEENLAQMENENRSAGLFADMAAQSLGQ